MQLREGHIWSGEGGKGQAPRQSSQISQINPGDQGGDRRRSQASQAVLTSYPPVKTTPPAFALEAAKSFKSMDSGVHGPHSSAAPLLTVAGLWKA